MGDTENSAKTEVLAIKKATSHDVALNKHMIH
ncbi:hypothetical protein SPPR111872_19025 [Sphingobacterium prati]